MNSVLSAAHANVARLEISGGIPDQGYRRPGHRGASVEKLFVIRALSRRFKRPAAESMSRALWRLTCAAGDAGKAKIRPDDSDDNQDQK
jgi:hypothetical protein